MTMTRGGLAKTLAPGYRKIIFETYKERPIEGTKLVNVNSSNRAYEEDFPIAGFGALQTKTEGGPVAYQDALQGAVKRYTWSTAALAFRVTEEMYEDDLYGIMGNKMSKALGRSARNHTEIVMHAPYNNAFNTAYAGFVTGESLCSTSHATLRGSTIANRPATDADFGLLAFQAAIEHFHSLTDESGLPMLLVPKTLIYNPGDDWIVSQVLRSKQLPGTNLNDLNRVSELGVSPHMSHYLTDSDAWFLIADEHDVNYFDRKKITMSATDDWETGDRKFKVTRRNGSGFGGWRGVYGTQGI